MEWYLVLGVIALALAYIFMNYIKIDIRNNSKKELKTKVCQTHDEIFVSSFSVQHKNFVFGHLLKYTKTVQICREKVEISLILSIFYIDKSVSIPFSPDSHELETANFQRSEI